VIDLVYALGTDLLRATADVLREGGLAVPERQFVETGSVALAPIGQDGRCNEQIVVVTSGIRASSQPPLGSGPRDRAARPVANVWSTTLTVQLHRCHAPAASVIPSRRVVDDSARKWMMDGWQLARGLGHRWGAGTLLPSLSAGVEDRVARVGESQSVRLGNVDPINPQGGVAGWLVPVTVMLPDLYDPERAAVLSS
jgi:hypothetical protein